MSGISRRSLIQSASMVAGVPALGAVPLSRVAAQAPGSDAIEVEQDVLFGKGGDMELRLDVYHPAAVNAKRVAIIHLHGGGFARGSKAGVAIPARAFAEQGYVSIASAYRLTGQARWPAPIEDTKAAIRWTRAHADRLSIDADKIAVAGYSAGGLLALFAAGTGDRPEFEGNGGNGGASSKVAACIAGYPAVTARPRRRRGSTCRGVAGQLHFRGLRSDDFRARGSRRDHSLYEQRRLLRQAERARGQGRSTLVPGRHACLRHEER